MEHKGGPEKDTGLLKLFLLDIAKQRAGECDSLLNLFGPLSLRGSAASSRYTPLEHVLELDLGISNEHILILTRRYIQEGYRLYKFLCRTSICPVGLGRVDNIIRKKACLSTLA